MSSAGHLRLRAAGGGSARVWRDVGPEGESLPWWGRPTETPAVFALERSSKEMVHESCTADTRDHEDHTFCGKPGSKRLGCARERAPHAIR